MLKRLIWNLSILIISGTLIAVSVLDFLHKDLLFNNLKQRKFLAETIMLRYELSKILDSEIESIFQKTEQVLKRSGDSASEISFLQITSSNYELLSYFSVQNILTKKYLFQGSYNGNMLNSEQPCVDSFYKIDESNNVIICRVTPEYKIFIGLSTQNLLDTLYVSLKNIYPVDKIPLLETLTIENKNIYINIADNDIKQNQEILRTTDQFLYKRVFFQFYLKGQRIFTEPVIFSSPEISQYNIYYNPLISQRTVSTLELFINVFLFFLGLLLPIVGLRLKEIFSLRARIENFSLHEHVQHFDKSSQEINFIEEQHMPTPQRDLPELRKLISEVIQQEIFPKKESSEENTSSSLIFPESILTFSDDKMNVQNQEEKINSIEEKKDELWKQEAIEKFEDISYILESYPSEDYITIKGITRTLRLLEYHLPKEKFYFPTLFKNYEPQYIYKEAGKTSLIKHLLEPSFINPMTMDSAMIIPDNNKYIIILFADELEQNFYREIYSFIQEKL